MLPLILLPGMDGTGRLFGQLIRVLSAGFEPRPVAYPTQDVRTYPQLDELAWAACPTERPFAIVAESFSGPIALRVASRRPAGLVGVVLVATFVVSPVALSWTEPLVGAWLFRVPPREGLLRRILVGRDAPAGLVRDVAAAIRSVSPQVMAARARDVLRVDASDALRRCPVPLLYLAGAKDRLVDPGVPASMQRLNPALQLEILEAPHLVLQRAPGDAARTIGRFLGGLPGAAEATGGVPNARLVNPA